MLKTALFWLKKLRLRHFCRENLDIRVLRTKFWVKSAFEDAPQVVPACEVVSREGDGEGSVDEADDDDLVVEENDKGVDKVGSIGEPGEGAEGGQRQHL